MIEWMRIEGNLFQKFIDNHSRGLSFARNWFCNFELVGGAPPGMRRFPPDGREAEVRSKTILLSGL